MGSDRPRLAPQEGTEGNLQTKLFSFWSGTPLSYLERLCLASMLRAGHPVDVYSYDEHLVVPAGVTLRSASEVLPESKIVREGGGSWALVSDMFRYEGLSRGLGIWIDLDVLLLRDLDGMGDHLYGWQDPYLINGAILHLPPDSSCLRELLSLCYAPVVVPPQWPLKKKLIQKARALVGAHVPVWKLEWGSVGPMALTHFVSSKRLLHHSQPTDVFYPVHFMDAATLLADDAAAVEAKLTSSTRAIHLWNNCLGAGKGTSPPPASFIAKMCNRFGVVDSGGA